MRLRSAESSELRAEVTRELALGVRSAVRQGPLYELPDALIGVELGGIARESVEVEPGVPGLQGAEVFAAVDRAVVPDHDHGSPKVAKQVA